MSIIILSFNKNSLQYYTMNYQQLQQPKQFVHKYNILHVLELKIE